MNAFLFSHLIFEVDHHMEVKSSLLSRQQRSFHSTHGVRFNARTLLRAYGEYGKKVGLFNDEHIANLEKVIRILRDNKIVIFAICSFEQ